MRAALVRRWGGSEVVDYGEVSPPRRLDDQLLVRVEACALNHLDILVREGAASASLDLPHVLGSDVVGVVEEAGDGDRALVGRRVLLDPAIGDGVLGAACWGGLAELVVVPAANALVVPDGDADPCRYAALPMAYATAHRMLFSRGGLRSGEAVVVLGAAGGVGVACVQLAAMAGARVVACSSSAAKLARLRQLGATETVNSADEVVRRRVRDITGGGADLVVDYLGRETWPETLRCVRPGGRIVTCGATTGHDAATDLRYVFARELTILGSNGWASDDLHELVELVVGGRLEPVVHAVFPLSQARDAIAELEERRAVGKVVVVPETAS